MVGAVDREILWSDVLKEKSSKLRPTRCLSIGIPTQKGVCLVKYKDHLLSKTFPRSDFNNSVFVQLDYLGTSVHAAIIFYQSQTTLAVILNLTRHISFHKARRVFVLCHARRFRMGCFTSLRKFYVARKWPLSEKPRMQAWSCTSTISGWDHFAVRQTFQRSVKLAGQRAMSTNIEWCKSRRSSMQEHESRSYPADRRLHRALGFSLRIVSPK